MELHSPAFQSGGEIPRKYTADGENISPPLQWSHLPPGTMELLLLVDDPDAPGPEPFVHWLMYKIPPTVSGLPEGLKHKREPGIDGALHGLNSMRNAGYDGPGPPRGRPHHYHFKLIALDRELAPQPQPDKDALARMVRDHVVDFAEFEGIYQRPRH